jgi:hypothetical protein
MRKTAFIIFTISILNLACVKRVDVKNENDFDRFTKEIPILNLPFSSTCETCCKTSEIKIDTLLNSKYNPNNYLIVGKFSINSEFLGIIYAGQADILVPILITYDITGNKLAEEAFLSHTHCGRIVDNYGASFFSIDKQFEIIEKDTNLVFLMDTTNFSILDTIERNINLRKYKIDKSGKIIKINAS